VQENKTKHLFYMIIWSPANTNTKIFQSSKSYKKIFENKMKILLNFQEETIPKKNNYLYD